VIVTAAVLVNDGRILIAKRSKEKKWEFPGGKMEENEGVENCIERELREELGISVERLKKFMVVEGGDIILHVFLVPYKGEIDIREHSEIKWVDVEELEKYEFMEVDKEVVKKLKKMKLKNASKANI